jgi:hypothetical protein
MHARIMFPPDLHDDPIHTLTHHQLINLDWCSNNTHPRNILSTGQPDGGTAERTDYGPSVKHRQEGQGGY